MTTNINDAVLGWGLRQPSPGPYTYYDEAKRALINGRTNSQILAAAGEANWNLALASLASTPAVLAQDAVLWLDSQYSQSGEQTAVNQGTGGSVLDAVYGSGVGAFVRDGALRLPGVTGNYVSVPDEAALDITGDLEIVAHLALDDWDDGSYHSIVTKRDSEVVGDAAYELMLVADDLRFQWYDSGTAGFRNATSTVGLTVIDGEPLWIKATLDADNGASGFTVTFYTSTNGTDWTQLGAQVTAATAATIQSTTSKVEIGSYNSGAGKLLAGSVYRAIVRNGIDGTAVLDINMASVPDWSETFTAATGQTVTVNSTGADTNDPLLLTHTGENYAYFPGTAGNYVSVPDEAALDITGDIEIVVRCAADDWFAQTTSPTLVGKCVDTTQRSYYLGFASPGSPNLTVSVDGTAQAVVNADALVPFVNGQTGWLKVTRDAGTGDTEFYTAADQGSEPTAWTQLGTTRPSAPSAIFVSTSDVEIGARFAGAGQVFNGRIFNAIVRDGIDGTTVLDFNAATDITDAGATSFTASTGQTVTVSRSTSGRKTALVTRPVWLFGTDDYLEVADNALLDFGAADDFTVLSVVRQHGAPTSFARLMSKRVGTGAGWNTSFAVTNRGAYGVVDDGTDEAADIDIAYVADNSLATYGMLVDRTAETLTAFNNDTVSATPVSTSAVGAVASGTTLRVGASSTGAPFLDAEVVAVAVWDRVLTTDEIAEINTFYGTGS